MLYVYSSFRDSVPSILLGYVWEGVFPQVGLISSFSSKVNLD